MTFQEVADHVRGDDNPAMKEAFFKGRSALEAIHLNEQTPTIIPALEVSRNKVYWYELYSKVGMLTENQWLSIFSKTPQQLSVNPIALEDKKLGEKTNYYPISLVPLLASRQT